jgi:hypothetical protein
MSYFTNYPTVNYNFGNEIINTSVQDIGAYIDLIDRVKDDISFYEEYNLRDGDRPDQVSNDLYGSPDYYWTFYLLNDELKRRGQKKSILILLLQLEQIFLNSFW